MLSNGSIKRLWSIHRQKAMYELEGGADFRNLSFHFLMRSLNLFAGDSIKIKPGQTKVVPMCLDTHAIKRDMTLAEKRRLDIDLYSRENEKVMVNLKTERKDKLVQTIPAVMSKGTISLLLLIIQTQNGRLINIR